MTAHIDHFEHMCELEGMVDRLERELAAAKKVVEAAQNLVADFRLQEQAPDELKRAVEYVRTHILFTDIINALDAAKEVR